METISYYNRTDDGHDRKLVSDQAAFLVQLVIVVILSGSVSVVGITTNVINIVVFLKQGAHKEHGSVNLLGLAVVDLLLVTNGVYKSFCFAMIIIDPPNISWEPFDLMYLTAGWPHRMCVQMSRSITAYVAFERCFCVVFPFKVKSVFTPKRSILILASLILGIGLSYSPVYIKQKLKYKTNPLTNITKLVVVQASDWIQVTNVMWYINSVVFNQGSVAVVLVCTLITVSRVRLSKTWRESMTQGNTAWKQETVQSKQSTTLPTSKLHKEKRLIITITLISIIFLVCFVPDFTYTLMYTIEPEVDVKGTYQNLSSVMNSFTFFMETFNSSINIIVYYKMSSRYKQILCQMLGLPAEKQ